MGQDALGDATASLDHVLGAMELGLNFMESEESHINLDAVIGTRIVGGKGTFWITRFLVCVVEHGYLNVYLTTSEVHNRPEMEEG